MNIEGYLLRVRSPSLVAEAVDIFTVRMSNKRVILGGDSLLIVLAVVQGVLNLATRKGERQRSVQSTPISPYIRLSILFE